MNYKISINENVFNVEYDGEFVDDVTVRQIDIDSLAVMIDGEYVPLRQALQDKAEAIIKWEKDYLEDAIQEDFRKDRQS